MKRNRSFMNKLKRSGPSVEPCGTPAITSFQAAKFIVDLNSLSSVLHVTTHELNACFEKTYAFSFAGRRP